MKDYNLDFLNEETSALDIIIDELINDEIAAKAIKVRMIEKDKIISRLTAIIEHQKKERVVLEKKFKERNSAAKTRVRRKENYESV